MMCLERFVVVSNGPLNAAIPLKPVWEGVSIEFRISSLDALCKNLDGILEEYGSAH